MPGAQWRPPGRPGGRGHQTRRWRRPPAPRRPQLQRPHRCCCWTCHAWRRLAAPGSGLGCRASSGRWRGPLQGGGAGAVVSGWAGAVVSGWARSDTAPTSPPSGAAPSKPQLPTRTCGDGGDVGHAVQAHAGGGVKATGLERGIAVPQLQVVAGLAGRHAAAHREVGRTGRQHSVQEAHRHSVQGHPGTPAASTAAVAQAKRASRTGRPGHSIPRQPREPTPRPAPEVAGVAAVAAEAHGL